MKSTVSGKVAVVTGSSRGIGKAIAMELARQGASVVLNGRKREPLEAAERELKNIHSRIFSVCCDVTVPEGGTLLIRDTLRHFGRIDILVNNVGASMRGSFAELDSRVFTSMFESNILGAVLPTQAALVPLRAGRGSIVFISSLAGLRGLPFTSAYSSSKMALRGLAESLRIEERGNHLHIGLVYVGFTENDPGKEVMNADGTLVPLGNRIGNRVHSKESVARAVVKNIRRRKFISVLTPVGKLLALVQPLFPHLVETIIARNIKLFADLSK